MEVLVVEEALDVEEAGVEELPSDELTPFPPQEASNKEPARTNKKDRRVEDFMKKSSLSGIGDNDE